MTVTGRKSACLVLVLLALAACKTTTTTHISQSYRSPGFERTSFQKLFVIGVAEDQAKRIDFEDAFSAAITREGGRAIASSNLLPESTRLSEERIHGAVRNGSFDGVLITRLLSVDQNTTFTPPRRYNRPRTTFYMAGPAWGMGFGGYYGFYGTTFTEVHRPGYFTSSKTVRLETTLYSVATNDLIWTAQSETLDPASVPALLRSMTSAVAKRLKEEGLIP